jgi:DNA primase
MANPGDFASTVKQQADIVRIIGEYISLKKAGAQNFSGLCPFHGEKTASFNVHASRQFFHCFGCGVSGDVFTFVQKIEHITFPEAVRVVAQKLGIAVPKVQFNSPQEAREAKVRGVLLDLHEAACKFFQQALRRPEGAAAREYLKGRGLNEEAIERFRIGFAPESGFLLRDALKGQAEDELLRESGLFSWKEREASGGDRGPSTPPLRGSAQDDTRGGNRDGGAAQGHGASTQAAPKAALYSKFRNRVMFPICNEQGKIIAFTGRTLATDDKAGPKYLNSPETPIYQKSRVLYNLHLAKEAMRQLDYVILVEGQMDCISVYNAGFHNVIASSGTAFTEIQARLLARLTKKILINFDPDTAGANAAERSLAMLVAEDFDIRVLTLDQGFDPDLYIRKKGAEAYGKALFGAARYFEYLIERARQMFPIRSAEGKAKAINYLLPHVQRIPSRIVRDEMAADIAQKLQIDSAVLRQELRHVASARTAVKVAKAAEPALTDSERLLIRALAGGELTYTVQDENGHDVEFSPGQQAHYTLTTERLHAGLSSEAILDALLDPANHHPELGGVDPTALPLGDADRRLLATALMNEDEPITPELLHGAIEALRRRSLEARQRELKVAIADAERKGNLDQVASLLQEKLSIDRYLR